MTQATQTLSYPPRATFRNFIVDLRPDGVVITILPDWRRLTLAVIEFLLWIGFALVSALGWRWLVTMPGQPFTIPDLFFPASVFATGSIRFAAQLIHLFNSGRYEVDADHLTWTKRKILEVQLIEWPRELIADLRVERIRLEEQAVRRRALVLRTTAGTVHAIHRGPLESLDFLCTTLKEALRLSDDPTGLDRYKPPPPRTRLRHLYHARGVEFNAPPPYPWICCSIIGLFVATAGFLFADYANRGPHFFESWPDTWAIPILSAAGFGSLAFFVAGLQISHLRCWTTLGVDGGTLAITQTGLTQPCNFRLNVHEVERIFVTEVNRRPVLEIAMKGGERIHVLRRGRSVDLAWICDGLNLAVSRFRR
jgi:hypothetical protein